MAKASGSSGAATTRRRIFSIATNGIADDAALGGDTLLLVGVALVAHAPRPARRRAAGTRAARRTARGRRWPRCRPGRPGPGPPARGSSAGRRHVEHVAARDQPVVAAIGKEQAHVALGVELVDQQVGVVGGPGLDLEHLARVVDRVVAAVGPHLDVPAARTAAAATPAPRAARPRSWHQRCDFMINLLAARRDPESRGTLGSSPSVLRTRPIPVSPGLFRLLAAPDVAWAAGSSVGAPFS